MEAALPCPASRRLQLTTAGRYKGTSARRPVGPSTDGGGHPSPPLFFFLIELPPTLRLPHLAEAKWPSLMHLPGERPPYHLLRDVPGLNELVEIDPGLDPHPVEHEHQ